MRFIFRWFTSAVAVFVTVWIVPGVEVYGGMWAGPLVFSLVLAFVNATIRPVMHILDLPFTLVTFGFGVFIINTIALILASTLSCKVFGMGIVIDSFFLRLLLRLSFQLSRQYLKLLGRSESNVAFFK